MEKVIANQVEFVRTLCLKRNKRSAKQWADLSVLERTEVAEAVKRECKDDVDRLTKDASPWCTRFVDYIDSQLLNADGTTPKLVVLNVPAAVRKAERKPFENVIFFKSCFDDDDDALDSTITAKATSLAKLLFFKAVQRFGHLNVEYSTKYFKRASRRSNDVYGNPRTTRAKVRVVDAIGGDESLSRKFYAAGPAILNEADLTVIFARNLPSIPEDDDSVELFRIIKFPNGAYRIGKYLSLLIPTNG